MSCFKRNDNVLWIENLINLINILENRILKIILRDKYGCDRGKPNLDTSIVVFSILLERKYSLAERLVDHVKSDLFCLQTILYHLKEHYHLVNWLVLSLDQWHILSNYFKLAKFYESWRPVYAKRGGCSTEKALYFWSCNFSLSLIFVNLLINLRLVIAVRLIPVHHWAASAFQTLIPGMFFITSMFFLIDHFLIPLNKAPYLSIFKFNNLILPNLHILPFLKSLNLFEGPLLGRI